jgi:hypothetical protein
MMKKLILLLLISFNAYAVDLGTVDPTDTGKGTLTLTCVKPLQYEDSTNIAIGEQVDIQWKVGVNGGAVDNNVGILKDACSEVVDLTQVPDGDYVYKVTATARNKESILSPEGVTITVKRIPNPNSPTGIDGVLSWVDSLGGYLACGRGLNHG